MKFIIAFTAFCFLCIQVLAQNNTEELNVLLEAMKIVGQQSPVIYVKNTNHGKKKPERIIQKITTGKFYDFNGPEGSIVEDPITGETITSGSPSDSLILTEQEKKFLIKRFSQKVKWPDHLLKNSIAVKNWDEGYLQLAILHRAEPQNHTYRYCFGFSRPVFIRNGSVCLISIAAMCGGGCGTTDISFYRKKGNLWQPWFSIGGGNF